MEQTAPIRVMIVDDQPVVRSGLVTFLMVFDDLQLVGEAANGAEAVKLCEEQNPDVILMDMVMPGANGAEVTQAIKQRHPHPQIIGLTSFKDEALVQQAMQAGAISYLLKNVTADELASAIRAAHAGRSTLAPEATAALVQAASHPPTPGFDLTTREKEVLALMAEGLSNPDIAQRLVVSRSTVKFHVSSILSKLGATSRAEAAALAVQHHLVN
jgi:NarL family two-component system response regulator LiaR